MERNHSSVFLDEAALWQRALGRQEIERLARTTSPLASSLPSLLLERPGRMIFHRGEASARLILGTLLHGGSARPIEAVACIPALGISEKVVLQADQTATITLHPWKVLPGVWPFTVTSSDGTLNVQGQIEIVAALMPDTIFWDPWPFRVDDKIVCLPPDMLRQYLWIAVAHPLDNLGLYGLGELRKCYVPEGTREALRQTLADVFPLGILTGGLPAGPVPVAYLHTEGQLWQGPGDNPWIEYWFNRQATRALAETRLRYDWIGDDHVAVGWLNRYRAVVVPGAWRLPEQIYARLVDYARGGGTVVVDKRCRAEIPGAVVLDYQGRAQEAEVVGALGDWARQFRAAHPEPLRLGEDGKAWLLDKFDGPARFVFVVNDRMVPGLLGADKNLHGNLGATTGPLRDRGLPQRVRVVLPAVAGQAVYEVRAHRPATPEADAVDVNLNPGDASVLAVLPEPIAALLVTAPPAVSAGSEVRLQVSILSASGEPIAYRDLVEVTATDAQGRRLDIDRYVRVVGGTASIPLRLARAQPPGPIKIELLEWIAGKRAILTIDVQPPRPVGEAPPKAVDQLDGPLHRHPAAFGPTRLLAATVLLLPS